MPVLHEMMGSSGLARDLARLVKDRVCKRPAAPIYYGFCRSITETKFGFVGANLPQEPQRIDSSGTEFRFLCPASHLEEISILLGTYARSNSCAVVFQLFRGIRALGRPLAEDRFHAGQVTDNSFFSFRFPQIPDSAGSWFTVRLSSPDARSRNAIGVWVKRLPCPPQSLIDSCVTFQNCFGEFSLVERDVFLPHFQARSGCGSTLFGWSHNPDALYPLTLLPETRVKIPLVLDEFGLSQIALIFGTFDRKNSCMITVSVEDASSQERLCSSSVSALALQDNRQHVFPLDPGATGGRKRVRLVIESTDSSQENSVAVWGNRLRSVDSALDQVVSASAEQGFPSAVNFRHHLRPREALELKSVPERLKSPWHQARIAVVASCETLARPQEELTAILAQAAALGMSIELFDNLDTTALFNGLESFHVLLLPHTSLSDTMRDLVRRARALRIMVLGIADTGMLQSSIPATPSKDTKLRISREQKLVRALEAGCDFLFDPEDIPDSPEKLGTCLDLVRSKYTLRCLPKVSIVSILYGKEHEVPLFLESILRQNYPGEIEVILVNDKTRDASVAAARAHMEKATPREVSSTLPNFVILENEKNIGNCGSRNRGIAHARGDVLIVVDADCLLNSSFVEEHVRAHALGDADVVIGPFNLETGTHFPMDALIAFENSPERVISEMALQDSQNRESFLNCITRNISIQRAFLQRVGMEGPFDEQFSYSEDPASGYGWEDVEFGFRLHQAGARIKFIEEAFTVHISHPAVSTEGAKPSRSLLNLWRLVEKHPSVAMVARRWCLDTFCKLCAWSDSLGLPPTRERRNLETALAPARSLALTFSPKRRLKVLTFRWHCPHQYELYKLPHDFTLVKHIGPPFTNEWGFEQRPFPKNARFCAAHEVDPRNYDVAIVHFDENALAPERTNGVLEPSWGKAFEWFLRNVPIPTVAVCHGTPQFYGQYDINYHKPDLGEVIEEERQRLVKALGNVLVITNSHQAQREWRFENSRVIWQGFEPSEFAPASFEKGILSYGSSMRERPHYRGYFLYEKVVGDIPERFRPEKLSVPEPDLAYVPLSNAYAQRRFQNYVNSMRQYSVFFNPTIRSPMPRWRGEAMMCGLATVSARNHDVDMFIKNSENGFASNDPKELRDYLIFLAGDPAEARRVGLMGRETALDLFNHDRYLKAWDEVLESVLR